MKKSSLVLVLAFAVTGCGAPANVGSPSSKDDPAKSVGTFQTVEDDVLRNLAAIDRRVARRAHLEPREDDVRHLTMGSLLAEDPTLAVIDGGIDPFSFEARARGLAAVKATLATAPGDLPQATSGTLSAPALEKELLTRLVAEETLRLEEERALPRSASALVRALVETWQAPASQQHAAERDRWLTRRLSEVSASIAKGGAPGAALDVVRARELDDALDALEHAAESAGLVRSTAELVKLRELLEQVATKPAASASSDWAFVARRLETHIGLALAPDALDKRLDASEKALRGAAERAVSDAHLAADTVSAHAAPIVLGGGACAVAVPGSRVRSMEPSSERAAACRLRQAVGAANDDAARAYALVAMHDHVVVAQWALDVARGSATIAQASGKHRPLSRPTPEITARWERVALARPAAAIGGGLAADVLAAGSDPGARARAWSELGEVPLDIAERELSRAK